MPTDPTSGLTDQERACADALADAWRQFAALPRQHPDELGDFRRGVHGLQGLLAARIVRRDYPEYWPTYSNDADG